MVSSLVQTAAERFDAYDLEALPAALRRNSLDYYYLSIYPSLAELRPIAAGNAIPYPTTMRSAYIHVPFCSGVCDFCSYYLVALHPRRRAAIGLYLEHVKREFDYHAARTTLDLRYLYIGGGTPSLIPTDALVGFLSHLAGRGYLNPEVVGTLELHPEFFDDGPSAIRFLRVLKDHGLGRVSVGYQASDEALLAAANRRHGVGFMAEAIALLREEGFQVNIDLMYGLVGQSLTGWETTLSDAAAFAPDSISPYFLFVDRGTGLYERVRRGAAVLPDYRHIQTQHLMAQLYLEAHGYHELPNDFWARNAGDPATFRTVGLPSAAATLPIGPGAYGYYGGAQLANVFDLTEYQRRVTAGESPLWRAYRLGADESFHRDVMFALKNDPYLDCALFRNAYNRDPLERFAILFEKLERLALVNIEDDHISLTAKGRLCVEEMAMLFRHPSITPAADAGDALLAKHNFAPTYRSEL